MNVCAGPGYGYAWLGRRDAQACTGVEALTTAADSNAVAHYHHADRRQASLLARGLLRYLYQRLYAMETDVAIVKSADGCPALADSAGRYLLYASITHSHDMVAVALDETGAIGIDVELCRTERDWPAIARRIFPKRIAERLQSAENFYRAWCLYEAWGKANHLQHINVTQNSGLLSLLEDCLNDAIHPNVIMFCPDDDYQASVFRRSASA
ncbi:phosphopantetheinyl transferase [Methylohalomonas lacus]|uniref:Phosphopantetheinyl transferase n=1 Tax=Methylohalomonas lacus TaxID=398773 RepID=A0AAE3HL10_9GAMM|nr:phosphopantetheinyl transferase [Methylohalomonas lacus]